MRYAPVPSLPSGVAFESAESVLAGHPDKIADQISDLALDLALKDDPDARVGCEVLVTHNLIAVAGEFSPSAPAGLEESVRAEVHRIGYTRESGGWDPDNCRIVVDTVSQVDDLSRLATAGVAGDQAVTVGYASNESGSGIPLAQHLAHRLAQAVDESRKSGNIPSLRADGKTQVTVKYVDGRAVSIEDIAVSVHHDSSLSQEEMRAIVEERVVRRTLPEELLTPETEILVNFRNPFLIGGPLADTGLTGRKLVVDAYGPRVPVGGGCFSGKDPSKVDRAGAYLARYLALGVVASQAARECQVTLTFIKGKTKAAHVTVSTFDSNRELERRIERMIQERAPLALPEVAGLLDLRRPIYHPTATYGHFGRGTPRFPWEQTGFANDLVEGLRQING